MLIAVRRMVARNDNLYEKIMLAVVEHRLPPGTKLGEDRLAELFGVSRARVRQLLARLAHQGIITLHPNRGAFVAEPTLEQAREVFELRKLLEPALVKTVARRAGKAAQSGYRHISRVSSRRQTRATIVP